MLRGMDMKKRGLLSLLFVAALLVISGFSFINKADAVSLQYQVLQPNGQVSHADQYMDKPANVIIKDGKYYVSMTSSIPSWIGSHPVTYTSINNGDGQIVNNAHGATFKFSTTNLNQKIPVTMHLDVKVAKVNMDAIVYLRFLNVPALDSAASGQDAQTNNDNTDADANNDATQADNDQGNDANKDDANQAGQKVTIKKPVKLNQRKTPAKSNNSSDTGDSVIYPEKDKQKKNSHKGSYVAVGSGIVVLGAAIAAVIYYKKKF